MEAVKAKTHNREASPAASGQVDNGRDMRDGQEGANIQRGIVIAQPLVRALKTNQRTSE